MFKRSLKYCTLCQAKTPGNYCAPLQFSSLTLSLWTEVSVDFCDLLNGWHLLVVLDDYSQYPEVEILTRLDKTFSFYGISAIMTSNNGPHFKVRSLLSFLIMLDSNIEKSHRTGPQANGKAEIHEDNEEIPSNCYRRETNMKQELFQFLCSYHSTFQVWTKCLKFISLSKMCFCAIVVIGQDGNETICWPMQTSTVIPFKIRDMVLVKNIQSQTKVSMAFYPAQWPIMLIKGMMIIAERVWHKVTRNISHIKALHSTPHTPRPKDEDEIATSTPNTLTPGTCTPEASGHQYPHRSIHCTASYLEDYVIPKKMC